MCDVRCAICDMTWRGRHISACPWMQVDGWSFWQWKGHKCHYISAGEDNTGPIVVLVHGFGAHSYHWRYTVPALAKQVGPGG